MSDFQTAIAAAVAKLGTAATPSPAEASEPGPDAAPDADAGPESAPSDAPAPGKPVDVKPALPGTAPGATEPPPLDELGALMAKRKAEREAAEAADAQARELAELRKWKAEQEGKPKQTGMDPAAFLADPWTVGRQAGYGPAEIRQILQKITRRVLQPDVAALEVEVAQLKAQPAVAPETPKELEARLAALEAEREQARVQQVVAQYSSIAADKTRCATLAGLPEDERVQWGDNVAARYQEAGYQLTVEQIAIAADKAAREYYQARHGVLGAITPPSSKAGSNGAAAAPVSLTNDLQASAAEVPASFDESIARVKRLHEDRQRAASRSRRP